MFNYEVIVCTYNGERYIVEQLASIVEQTVKPQRIIVSDDGSTDGTLEKVKKFAATNAVNIEIKVRNGGEKGAEYNFLYALKETTEPYVFLSDQDDVWLNNKADAYKKVLEKVKDPLKPLLVFSDAEVVDEKLENIHFSFLASERLEPARQIRFRNLIFQNCVQGATVMINRALKEKVCVSDKIVMHDWWLGLIATALGQVIFITEPLIRYRQHNKNTIGHVHYGGRHILRKLMKIRSVAWQNRRIVRQAETFLDIYGNVITKEDQIFLKQLKEKQRVGAWQLFLFRYKIVRTTRARTLSLYFLY